MQWQFQVQTIISAKGELNLLTGIETHKPEVKSRLKERKRSEIFFIYFLFFRRYLMAVGYFSGFFISN